MSIVTKYGESFREDRRPNSGSLVRVSNREGQGSSSKSLVRANIERPQGLYGKWRSPEEVLYPSVNNPKPLLSPYSSLNPSPVRRIHGLATLNLYRPEYNKIR
ncbi:hypothetical protein [Kiloniella spongiae]|uniref:hypothetical protein n=1 Tax=Kiloniella spongiae TaxID=1489064 RepID=UPI0012E097AA|nr:hypothetical protein [Kiloniella spongiae]